MLEVDHVPAWFEFDDESSCLRVAAQPDFSPENIRLLRDRAKIAPDAPPARIPSWSSAKELSRRKTKSV